MLSDGQLDNIAESARVIGALERSIKRMKREGGRGDLDKANEDLEAAIEVFSVEAYADLTLSEIAQAGGRIERLAKKCRAIQQMEAVEDELEKAREAHRKLVAKARAER